MRRAAIDLRWIAAVNGVIYCSHSLLILQAAFSIVSKHIHLQGIPGIFIGSNCPGISGTVPDFWNLSQVMERYVNCPGRVLSSSVYM